MVVVTNMDDRRQIKQETQNLIDFLKEQFPQLRQTWDPYNVKDFKTYTTRKSLQI